MAADAQRLAVRDSAKARILGTVAGWILRVTGATLRMEVVDRCGITERGRVEGPVIWCIWHNRVFVPASVRNRLCKWRQATVLTSASNDGAILAAAVKVFGLGAVRGSSSRRGASALKELIRVLKQGTDAGVTPDGPRGPLYVMQPGVVKLAQAAQVPIMPLHVTFGRSTRLNSWDRFHIPWPFSRITVTFDELLAVPRKLDDDAFAAQCRKLEDIMRGGVDDYEDAGDADH
ncbi:MAG: lysophospholipid acyltransferase family protein [Akkermansiaceae bacterium]|nr:lysophospholipid acyltransferase family protein [Akkermansiaceae bacterium]NNM28194.1 lysophospholipid acyltransferase family protein [Akkermansiaceae bacterium]